MPKISAMRGIPITLIDSLTTGIGEVISIPSSFTRHQFVITGNDDPSIAAGKVQPAGKIQNDDDLPFFPIGGGEITVTSEAIEYNFHGIYSALACPITENIVDGSVTVVYTGS